MARVHHVRYQHGGRAFKAAFDAAFPSLPRCISMEEAERRITAALIAYDGVRYDEAAKFEQAKRQMETHRPAFEEFVRQVVPKLREVGEAASRAGFALQAATSKEAR